MSFQSRDEAGKRANMHMFDDWEGRGVRRLSTCLLAERVDLLTSCGRVLHTRGLVFTGMGYGRAEQH